jgi:hypothetical protein
MMTQPMREARRTIGQGLVVAGLFLQTAIVLRDVVPEHLSREASQRLLGVLMGSVLLVYANRAPKTLSPLAGMRCNPVVEQELRRFVAWSLTLGSVGYIAASLLAPFESAAMLATSILGASMLLVIVRITSIRFGAGRARGART